MNVERDGKLETCFFLQLRCTRRNRAQCIYGKVVERYRDEVPASDQPGGESGIEFSSRF